MIEMSSLVMTHRAKKVNIFLYNHSETYKHISSKFKNNKKIKVYGISYLEKFLINAGFFSYNIKEQTTKSDIIFFHNANLAYKFKRFYKVIPMILFFHTDKLKQIKKFKYLDKVLTVNKNSENKINKQYKQKKAFYLPNCIDYKNNNKGKNFFKKEELVFGCMGRLVEKKGFEFLIKTFLKIRNSKLLIAGDGPLMHKLNIISQNSSNIKMLGWVKAKETFFSKIDIFIVPSLIEPFGLVILEAMARGVPVISTKCDGPLDIIKNRYNGILVEKNNIDELINAVESLKNDLSLRKKISKNGLDTVKLKYSINIYKKNFFNYLLKK